MPFKIVKKEQLSDNMFRVTFHAPLVARRAQPGQFLMFRVDEFGERMPITISYFDREAGDVTVIMQRVWDTNFEGESRTVDMHIKTLRQKLGNSADRIKTIRNVGYVME